MSDSQAMDAEKKPAVEVTQLPTFPEGGSTAWLVVLGCWCTSFASFGIVNSFGVYETYYLSILPESASTIAWIGSIQTFMQFSATLIAGPLTDRYGARAVIWPASVLLVVAMMLTSICYEYWQFLMCQGLLLGTASGFLFAPALTVVGHYFFKKRAMAMSLASTGSPIGGVVYPVILNSLSFGWGQRAAGFLSLGLLIIAAVTLRPTSMRRKGALILLDAFRNPAYSLQVLALFLVVLGMWTPYFYLAEYCVDHGMNRRLAGYLFAILNAGSFAGRVLGAMAAGHVGQFNLIVSAALFMAVLLYCWIATVSTAGLIVLAVLIGASTGVIIALMMSTIAHTADHPSKIGTYIGQSTFIIGFAALGGPPIAGALIDGWTPAIVFSSCVVMAGAVVLGGARYAFAKDKIVV